MTENNFNLEHLQESQEVRIYSSDKDIYENEKIETYLITRENGALYLSYEKKNSFDEKDILNISFKNKISTIGTPIAKKIEANLTSAEKAALTTTKIIKNMIMIGENLSGKYEGGLQFTFPKIIQIKK